MKRSRKARLSGDHSVTTMRAPLFALLASASVGDGNTLPTECRIFAKGWNETSKGRFLYDDRSAVLVAEAFARTGTDLMIDLNHDSLEPSALVTRADAGDARGWCRIDANRGGECWLVNMTWTPDGAERLSCKKQRYLSPAFIVDDENRITEILNVAICAMPATFGAAPLVAAARRNIDSRLMAPAAIALERVVRAMAAAKRSREIKHGS